MPPRTRFVPGQKLHPSPSPLLAARRNLGSDVFVACSAGSEALPPEAPRVAAPPWPRLPRPLLSLGGRLARGGAGVREAGAGLGGGGATLGRLPWLPYHSAPGPLVRPLRFPYGRGDDSPVGLLCGARVWLERAWLDTLRPSHARWRLRWREGGEREVREEQRITADGLRRGYRTGGLRPIRPPRAHSIDAR